METFGLIMLVILALALQHCMHWMIRIVIDTDSESSAKSAGIAALGILVLSLFLLWIAIVWAAHHPYLPFLKSL